MKIEIKKNKNLSKKEKYSVKYRKEEFGEEEIKNFEKKYEPNTLWFFIKKKQ